jgi:hypothetical protein
MKTIFSMIVGASSAVATDLQAYVNAKKRRPEVTFDWSLLAIRAVIGALTGLSLSAIPTGDL